MLALLVSVALAQCMKDTDCKGDRVCTAGECTDVARPLVPAPAVQPVVPDPMAQAARIARVGELRAEVRDLKERLDDATLAGPIFKLLGATFFTVLGIALLDVGATPSCYAGCGLNYGTLGGGIASSAVAVVLWLWGGIQLRLRLRDRAELPVEIANREAQLKVLGAR